MKVTLPAPVWSLLRAQADKGQFTRSGVTFVVIDELCGPWCRAKPPFIQGRNELGEDLTLIQGLPLDRLTPAEAAAADSVLRQRAGWRKRFFPDWLPSWATLDGHPVAVYVNEQGSRWASLPYRLHAGGVQELLLARDVLLDQERAAPAELAAAEQMELFA